MEPDEQVAESSTAAFDEASDAALAAGDVERYQELENLREIAERNGTALPEIPPPSKKKATSETAADSETAPPQQEKKPKTGEDRKVELHEEIQELLKQRAALKAELGEKPGEKKKADPPPAAAEMKPAAAATKAKPPIEPKLDDFATYAEYQAADRAYIRELVKFEARETLEASRAEAEVQAANRAIETAIKERQAEAREVYSDFDEVALDKDTPITPAMDGWILKNSKSANGFGMHVLYRLGENKGAEARRIAALDAYDQVEALNEIRAEFRAGAKPETATLPVKKHTAAPPPAHELNARQSEPADPVMAALNRGDVAEYIRLSNAREIALRKGG
jgi:hypothetical protein